MESGRKFIYDTIIKLKNTNLVLHSVTQGLNEKAAWDILTDLNLVLHAYRGKNTKKITSHHYFYKNVILWKFFILYKDLVIMPTVKIITIFVKIFIKIVAV